MNNQAKAIIIDDEDGNREFLASILKMYCPAINIVGEAKNLITSLEIIKITNPNLIFLDICMPNGNGFELLDQLSKMSYYPKIIFTTAHSQYAVQAFRYEASDYLLKPINPINLQQSVKKVLRQLQDTKRIEQLKFFHKSFESYKDDSYTMIQILSGKSRIDIKSIIRCEADGNYTKIVFTNERSIISTKSLKQFNELLSPFNFLRIHQSHLINLNEFSRFIRTSNSSGGLVLLKNGDSIKVSRSRKKILLDHIKGV